MRFSLFPWLCTSVPLAAETCVRQQRAKLCNIGLYQLHYYYYLHRLNDPYLAIVAMRSDGVGVSAVEEVHDVTEPLEYHLGFVVPGGELQQTTAAYTTPTTDAARIARPTVRMHGGKYAPVVAEPEVARHEIDICFRFRLQDDRISDVVRRFLYNFEHHRST